MSRGQCTAPRSSTCTCGRSYPGFCRNFSTKHKNTSNEQFAEACNDVAEAGPAVRSQLLGKFYVWIHTRDLDVFFQCSMHTACFMHSVELEFAHLLWCGSCGVRVQSLSRRFCLVACVLMCFSRMCRRRGVSLCASLSKPGQQVRAAFERRAATAADLLYLLRHLCKAACTQNKLVLSAR